MLNERALDPLALFQDSDLTWKTLVQISFHQQEQEEVQTGNQKLRQQQNGQSSNDLLCAWWLPWGVVGE